MLSYSLQPCNCKASTANNGVSSGPSLAFGPSHQSFGFGFTKARLINFMAPLDHQESFFDDDESEELEDLLL